MQGCGREMHTTGSIDCLEIFKFAATSFMNTYFEQVIERDLAGQDAFLVLIRHMPDTSAERAVKKMPSFLFALFDSSCILTFAFNGELSEWPKEHDWKSCRRQKRLQGSNP